MKRPKKVLLLGAGGMGMAPLALYLRGAGVRVEAYDDCFTEPGKSYLKEQGVHVLDELNPIKVPDCIVHSSAIPKENEFLIQFENSEIPIFRRGDFLAKLFARHRVIAVVGSHGKTSVSGRLAWALRECKFEASHIVGAQFQKFFMPSGFYTSSKWAILEVDESDGSIEAFSPWMTICLNCDWDHVDQYQNQTSFSETLKSLFLRTKQTVICSDSSILKSITQKITGKEVVFFKGSNKPADFLKANDRAVKLAAKMLGFSVTDKILDKFPGMERRQSTLFESKDRMVVEDYAHHPTEIASLLNQREEKFPDHLMKVVFQPHRYTRTKALAPSFAEELARSDELYLLPTYGAFEKFDQSGVVETITGYLPPRLRDRTHIFKNFTELKNQLHETSAGEKDQIIFLGAGNINKWAHAFASWNVTSGIKLDAFGSFLQGRISPQTILMKDKPIGSMTTMGVGGATKWYAEPANIEDLRVLVEACEFFEVQRAMIGRGSNLLIPDQGFGGLVIRLRGPFWHRIDLRTEDTIIVGAGARLKEICKFACGKNLTGFEFLEGIPGTLGGALRMNAGAMGWEIFDLVEWVKFLLPDGQIKQIDGAELEVGYRYCKEAYDGIALCAKLKAEGRGQHLEIRKVIEQMSRKRRNSQPTQSSSGCVFRNPENHPAGWLIEQAGLKGEKIGDAGVSEVHGNFIVNHGQATTEHVVELIQRVQQRVEETHGVILEPEVNLLGQSWNQYLS
jgi:UDP-N-acetylmuramate--alanine ligase